MSLEELQPISGSGRRADAGSNSKSHSRVLARPEDMEDFDGL